VGPGASFTTHWQGKGAILNLHRPTITSGRWHFKCHTTMLQCRFRAGVLVKPVSRRHSHKGHREKRISAAPFLLRVLAWFLLPELSD